MKRRTLLIALAIAGSAFTVPVLAAPPEGKGHGNSGTGNPHKGNSGKGSSGNPGNSGGHGSPNGNSGHGVSNSGGPDRHGQYDARGRYYDYFDDYRDDRGHPRGGDAYADLVYAGITAALAREYALDLGLGGYSSLPPGIRKNLARGKPLPPGIAKKLAPGPLLARLPRHPGYEWCVAGSDLILVSIATAVVADILYDVLD